MALFKIHRQYNVYTFLPAFDSEDRALPSFHTFVTECMDVIQCHIEVAHDNVSFAP